MGQPRRASWWWFGAWTLVGAVLITGTVGAFGVLVVFLPVGAAGAAVLVAKGRTWPEAVGVAMGGGALALLVAYLNRDYGGCPPSPSSGTTYPGTRPEICSGTNPLFWLVLGAVLAVGSVGAFVVLRCRSEDSPPRRR